jgi:carbon monoxide dehydrogenase subunit G
MATITRELTIASAPDAVWRAIRDVAQTHRLFPGVLVSTTMEPGVRTVTFADGRVVREPILSIDDTRRRLAWTVAGGPLAHHNASMQVVEEGGKTRLIWITDVLPDAAAPVIEAIVEKGATALARSLAEV